MSDIWYYAKGDKSVGPLSLADLTSILSHVSSPEDVLVWKAGFEKWQRASSVSELAVLVIKPPPLPTIPPAVLREPQMALVVKDHEDHLRDHNSNENAIRTVSLSDARGTLSATAENSRTSRKRQTIKMFEQDTTRPGNVILQIGLLAYILTTLVCMASMNAANPMGYLVSVTVSLITIILLLSPLAFVIFVLCIVLGVPYTSLTYPFSLMQRKWRGLVGVLLLISVAFAALSAISEAIR
jgi:GYF domain 2